MGSRQITAEQGLHASACYVLSVRLSFFTNVLVIYILTKKYLDRERYDQNIDAY
ncbi:hypothetical protein DSUL_20056 [Desulfovibrionales bacterium]